MIMTTSLETDKDHSKTALDYSRALKRFNRILKRCARCSIANEQLNYYIGISVLSTVETPDA